MPVKLRGLGVIIPMIGVWLAFAQWRQFYPGLVIVAGCLYCAAFLLINEAAWRPAAISRSRPHAMRDRSRDDRRHDQGSDVTEAGQGVDWSKWAYGCVGINFLLVGMSLMANGHYVWSIIPFGLLIIVVSMRSPKDGDVY